MTGSVFVGLTAQSVRHASAPSPAPYHRTAEREQQLLGEELSREPQASCAERDADGDLGAPRHGAPDEQVGDIDARDEQDRGDHCADNGRGEQHRGAEIGIGGRLAKRHQVERAIAVRIGIRTLKRGGHDGDL